MPTNTRNLARIAAGQAFPSQGIFSMRDRLKMVRVHTTANAALMIKLKSVWNRTNQCLVGPPVCVGVSPATSVTVRKPVSTPQPAAGIWFRVDMRHKALQALLACHLLRRHNSPHSPPARP